jgi:hypothetical protein
MSMVWVLLPDTLFGVGAVSWLAWVVGGRLWVCAGELRGDLLPGLGATATIETFNRRLAIRRLGGHRAGG